MDLDAAIEYLNRGRTVKFSAADVATIRSVVAELGVVEFEGRQDGDFFTDVDGSVHVHPTMIVTSREVAGSVRTDTYRQWPYRIELSRWSERGAGGAAGATDRPMCQHCFNPLDDRHAEGCY